MRKVSSHSFEEYELVKSNLGKHGCRIQLNSQLALRVREGGGGKKGTEGSSTLSAIIKK